MYLKRTERLLVLALLVSVAAACRGDDDLASANGALPLDRTAWLGSAEGWGLLGLPLDGGALTYLSARDLESPTWAPPELNPLLQAWPGFGTIWLQFDDARIGFYDYSTGHLRTFERDFSEEVTRAVAIRRPAAIVVAPDDTSLALVGQAEPWSRGLEGRLVRLERAEGGNIVAVLETDSSVALLVVPPTGADPLGRIEVAGLQDLIVTAWGGRLYYLSGDHSDLRIHGLTLPELEAAGELELPEPGRALAITPSGHRIYVAAGRNLYVYDRLSGRPVGRLSMPGPVSSLRFGITGTNLLGRLDEDRLVVLQVGVDSVLGIIDADWGEHLPVAMPGGRLVTQVGAELVLYELPGLTRIARVEHSEPRIWMPVEWHPPRPRIDYGRPTLADAWRSRVASARERAAVEKADTTARDSVAGPGYYAVVSAARTSVAVEKLVSWLRSVGYPAQLDQHEDVMGVIWYRAMAGPYPSRARAEAAARSLGARYGYKPWILSIEDPDSRPIQADSIGRVGAASTAGEEGGDLQH